MPTACSCWVRAKVAISSRPGTIRGACCSAPNAAPYAQANITVVTIVVRRNSGRKSSKMLGRFKVPAAFFWYHVGDSGRNGRMTMSGRAGTTPDIKV